MSLLNPVNKSYCLHKLCESNYAKLIRLVPNLPYIGQFATALAQGRPALYLTVLEKAPYTLTFELSHCFGKRYGDSIEPAVKIRLYMDAKAAEVLEICSRPRLAEYGKNRTAAKEIMHHKWKSNYFLEKWLNHCLQLGYQFERRKETVPLSSEVL